MSGPTFCWQCGKPFKLLPSGATIYAVVVDPIGNTHRVHKVCLSDAKAEQQAVLAPPERREIPDE